MDGIDGWMDICRYVLNETGTGRISVGYHRLEHGEEPAAAVCNLR